MAKSVVALARISRAPGGADRAGNDLSIVRWACRGRRRLKT